MKINKKNALQPLFLCYALTHGLAVVVNRLTIISI
jgi:hypothetical protein